MKKESLEKVSWVKKKYLEGDLEAAIGNLLNCCDSISPSESSRQLSFNSLNIDTIFSPQDAVEVLSEWGVVGEMSILNSLSIEKLKIPAIVYLRAKSKYIVLLSVGVAHVHYIDLEAGYKIVAKVDFLEERPGLAISVSQIHPWTRETEKLKLEQKKNAKAYFLEHLLEIDEFITDKECDLLIAIAKSDFEKSKIAGNSEKAAGSTYRRSQSAPLFIERNEVVKRVRDKIINAINDNAVTTVERSHCVLYEQSDYYNPHFDVIQNLKENTTRGYSVLVYLNDNYTGGETNFPDLNLKINPKKGKGVIFKNLTAENRQNRLSLHAGLPVKTGKKYVFVTFVQVKVNR